MASRNQSAKEIILDLVNKNRRIHNRSVVPYQLKYFQICDVQPAFGEQSYDTQASVAEVRIDEEGDVRPLWSPIVYNKVAISELMNAHEIEVDYPAGVVNTLGLLEAINAKYGTALEVTDIQPVAIDIEEFAQDGDVYRMTTSLKCKADGPLFRGSLVVTLTSATKPEHPVEGEEAGTGESVSDSETLASADVGSLTEALGNIDGQ